MSHIGILRYNIILHLFIQKSLINICYYKTEEKNQILKNVKTDRINYFIVLYTDT